MGRPAQAPRIRTPEQNRRIWGLVSTLRKRAGLSEEDAEEVLRRFCRECSAQEHSSLLQEHQAAGVIAKLEAEVSGYAPKGPSTPAKREPWGERGPGPRGGQAITPRQQQVLSALFDQAGMDTSERRMGFCKRQFGLPWAQTQVHADALYEPLKAMILRRTTPGGLWARVRALVGRPELDRYKTDLIADFDRQYTEAEKTGRMGRVMTTHKLLKLIECELAVAEKPGEEA